MYGYNSTGPIRFLFCFPKVNISSLYCSLNTLWFFNVSLNREDYWIQTDLQFSTSYLIFFVPFFCPPKALFIWLQKKSFRKLQYFPTIFPTVLSDVCAELFDQCSQISHYNLFTFLTIISTFLPKQNFAF